MLNRSRIVRLLTLAVLGMAPVMSAHADQCSGSLQQTGGLLMPACPAVPMLPKDGAGQKYGFNYLGLGILDKPANGLNSPSGLPRSAILNAVSDFGVTYVRTQANWSLAQPAKPAGGNEDKYYLTDVNPNDAETDSLKALGIKQIMIIMGAPQWALRTTDQGACSVGQKNCFGPPDVDNPTIKAAWEAWVKYIVNRYPNIAAVEVWNEPNNANFWDGAQDPALYARILTITADAVHQARPELTVLSGGLAVQTPDTHKTYLEDMYVALGADAAKFDAIALHLYPCREDAIREGTTYPYQKMLDQWIYDARELRGTYDSLSKPLWVTEMGLDGSDAPSDCGEKFNETEQNYGLALALDWAKQQNAKNHDVPVVILHTLFNTHARTLLDYPIYNREYEFGLVAWALAPITNAVQIKNKPSYATVRCKLNGSC